MTFLDPRSDIVFKKLFGSKAHKNILMSFLNAVLEREEGNLIIDVTINDPHNVPETPLSKISIVDVRCTDQKQNHYILEMQVANQADYAARAQYYSSLALSRQLSTGESYSQLVPVIFVGVLDFSLFKTKNYISHHFIRDNETNAHELKHLEFHFIELEKFNKHDHELTSLVDKWIFFLKHAASLKQIPQTLHETVLEDAFTILAQGSWSRTELEAYDRYLDAIRSAKSQLETAEEIGREKGIAAGEARGERKKAIDMAQKLLNVLDVTSIAQISGLTIEEVEALKKNDSHKK